MFILSYFLKKDKDCLVNFWVVHSTCSIEFGDYYFHNKCSKLNSIFMPGLHLQLNRRKSRAPPPTQPSLKFPRPS